jgi:hypothetical protein
MQGRRNKSPDGEALSERDGEHVVPGGLDRTDADKDQCKRSDKFREQWAKLGHAWDAIRLCRP